MRAAEANFIRRQAYAHAVVTALAILTFALLAYYFLRTLDRSLELKAREESEHHLKALGAMAATLAHEIRNPLGAMKGLLELALIVASSSTLSAQDLPLLPAEGPAAVSRPITLAEIERAAILQALARNQGERRATAGELGISLRTLQYRLKEYTRTPG